MENFIAVLLEKIFSRWNDWIEMENEVRKKSGATIIGSQNLRIVGQTALLLADLPFPVTTTMDLDLTALPDYGPAQELKRLLLEEGIRLEPDAHLIWMPDETHYREWLNFSRVGVRVADARGVMVSKYRFNRPKDRALIDAYRSYDSEFRRAVTEAGIRWRES